VASVFGQSKLSVHCQLRITFSMLPTKNYKRTFKFVITKTLLALRFWYLCSVQCFDSGFLNPDPGHICIDAVLSLLFLPCGSTTLNTDFLIAVIVSRS